LNPCPFAIDGFHDEVACQRTRLCYHPLTKTRFSLMVLLRPLCAPKRRRRGC